MVTGAQAQRILFEGDRAVGRRVRPRRAARDRAGRGEVILCAGAFNSPQLLMLSGIGPAEHLRAVGIEPRLDSPHVGRHLIDHPMPHPDLGDRRDRHPVRRHPPALSRRVRARARPRQAVLQRRRGGHPHPHRHRRPGPRLPDPVRRRLLLRQRLPHLPGHAFTLAPSYVGPRSEGAVRLRSADPYGAARDQPELARRRRPRWRRWSPLPLRARARRHRAAGRRRRRATSTPARAWPATSSSRRGSAPSASTPTTRRARAGWAPRATASRPELRVRGVDGPAGGRRLGRCRDHPGNTNAPAIMVGRARRRPHARPPAPARRGPGGGDAGDGPGRRPLAVGGAQGLGDLGHGIDLGDGGEAVGQVLAHRLQKRGSNRLQLGPAGLGRAAPARAGRRARRPRAPAPAATASRPRARRGSG